MERIKKIMRVSRERLPLPTLMILGSDSDRYQYRMIRKKRSSKKWKLKSKIFAQDASSTRERWSERIQSLGCWANDYASSARF